MQRKEQGRVDKHLVTSFPRMGKGEWITHNESIIDQTSAGGTSRWTLLAGVMEEIEASLVKDELHKSLENIIHDSCR